MALMSRSLAETLAGRHGVVTLDELLHDGFSRRAIARHVARGSLVRVHNGVFRSATSPETFEAQCAAACAADPEVIITGTAAGRLWGFHHIGRPDVPMALVAHARSPITRGVLLRRTNLLDDTDRRRARRRNPHRESAARVVRLRTRPGRRALRAPHGMGARPSHHHADAVAYGITDECTRAHGCSSGESGALVALGLATPGRLRSRTPRPEGARTSRREPPGSPVSVAAHRWDGDPPRRCRARTALGGRDRSRHVARWSVRRSARQGSRPRSETSRLAGRAGHRSGTGGGLRTGHLRARRTPSAPTHRTASRVTSTPPISPIS